MKNLYDVDGYENIITQTTILAAKRPVDKEHIRTMKRFLEHHRLQKNDKL